MSFKPTSGSILVLSRWLNRLHSFAHQSLKDQNKNTGELDIAIGKTLSSIHSLVLPATPKHVPPDPPEDKISTISTSWLQIIEDEIFRFNSYGTEYIGSCTDALIKIQGIKRKLDQFSNTTIFRGEHRFGWPLIPKFARNRNIEIKDPRRVTPEELEAMRYFQNSVLHSDDLKVKIFGNSNPLDIEHPSWWHIMQHYDTIHGTRMIDVTSSLFSALYFACADWNGEVDETTDGKLYMFPYLPGRTDNKKPERCETSGRIISGEDESKDKLSEYFSIEDGIDFPRFRHATNPNDRSLAQDGFFAWQPYFTKPLKTFQTFPFRVFRGAKIEILSELSSIGYTRDRIIGSRDWILNS